MITVGNRDWLCLHLIVGRDESKCWRWQFTLGATLQDDTGSVEAELTPTAAEVMVGEEVGQG